mgnify:FL=1
MGLNRIREDSVKKKQQQKTMKQLQQENEALAAQVTDLQMALCDVYELAATMKGGENDG